MRSRLGFLLIAALVCPVFAAAGSGGPRVFVNNKDGVIRNPIVRHLRTADPSAHVWADGRLWIYTSHDMDNATNYNNMDGYRVFSTSNLKTWVDHGEILHSRDVDWGMPGGGLMYAPSAAFKNGTYYLYFPHMARDIWKWCVGVATSTRPEGPFTNRGYVKGAHEIDPCCFVDDDGRAYLYWGGGEKGPYAARLKDNMTELAEAPRTLDYGSDGFGEGVYMHKYLGKYYLSYTCFKCGQYQGHYAMGDSPLGPFVDKGSLSHNPPGAQDHHSMAEFKGQWYYFYHLGNYRNGPVKGSMFRRNICMDPMYYNEDGTIREVVQTVEGRAAFPELWVRIDRDAELEIPGRIEAEHWARATNAQVETTLDRGGGQNIGWIGDGEWCVYKVNARKAGTYRFSARVATDGPGGTIEVSVDGTAAGSLHVDKESTGGWQDFYTTKAVGIRLSKGPHEIRTVFRGNGAGLFNVNWIEFR
jgi:hypothetical protein